MTRRADNNSVDIPDKLFGRMFIKRGTAIKLCDKEVEFNPEFKMFLHTKIANPHYKPELQVTHPM